jgi:hypothetical protein
MPRTFRIKAEVVDDLRKQYGMSQTRLATEAGVDVASLRRWMKGSSAYLENIASLAKALNTQPHQLIVQTLPAKQGISRTHVDMVFKVSAALERPEQVGQLVCLTKQMVEAIEASGMKVTRHETLMGVQQSTERELKRIIALVYGLMDNGTPFWVFVAVRPEKYTLFIAAHEAQTLNLYEFEPYGEIIISGEGKQPPDEITLKIAEVYQTNAELLLAAVADDVMEVGTKPKG